MNQSDLEANSCTLLQERKNVWEHTIELVEKFRVKKVAQTFVGNK